MALECTFTSLTKVDQTDPEAVQALWEWALLLTLGCAAVGALIGWPKGRWLAGFVWGAALGPIGWIVIAFAKPGRECPECGQGNQPDAKVCRGCGIDFRKHAGQSTRSRLKAQDRSRGW
jgi:ribosomal protein L40E